MLKVAKYKLGIKFYKLQKVSGLSEAQKEKRVKRCKQLLKWYGDEDVQKILFPDENFFITEQKINNQNHLILPTSITQIPRNTKTVNKW